MPEPDQTARAQQAAEDAVQSGALLLLAAE